MERLSNLQPSGYDLYNLACFRSLLSGIAAQPGSGLDGRRRPQPGRTGRRNPAPGRRRRLAGRRIHAQGTPTSIPCGRARTFKCCSWTWLSRVSHSRSKNETDMAARSIDHNLSRRRDDPGPVRPIRIFQHRRERHRHVRRGHASHGRQQAVAESLHDPRGDLGAHAAGLRSFLDDDDSPGFLHRCADRFVVDRREAADVDDLGVDALAPPVRRRPGAQNGPSSSQARMVTCDPGRRTAARSSGTV